VQFPNPYHLPQRGRIRGTYDAARWTEDNERHWINATAFGPNEENNQAVRQRLRERSRYETYNNSYLNGMITTLCNDFTGSGPSLQITDNRLTEAQSKSIEDRFNRYARKIKLRQLLWKMRHAKIVDGESFALQYTDGYLADPMGRYSRALSAYGNTEVLINYQIIEADQCTSYDLLTNVTGQEVDGIRFDRNMRPTEYYILYHHPQDTIPWYNLNKAYGRWIPARYVLHWLRQSRPWLRGIPETVQALPICAYLRRFNLAVLSAAETAASFAGVLESDAPANNGPLFGQDANINGEEEENYEPFDAFPIQRGMFVKLPDGHKLNQMRAEYPGENNAAFVDTVVREIARSLLIPFNRAVGSSKDSNFSSGTLDHQMYNVAIEQERRHCEDYLLGNILGAWYEEASRMPAYLEDLPDDFTYEFPEYSWRWDAPVRHVDPEKSAKALAELWDKGFITDDQIQLEEFNRDPKDYYEAVKKQNEAREKLGLPLPGVTTINQNGGDSQQPNETSQQDDQSNQTQEQEA
jgi:capsid protein